MADLNRIRGRDRRPCYVLRVAGLKVLYGTHQPPSVTSSGVVLTRRAAVLAGSLSFGRRFEENTRLVEVDNLKMELACDDQYTADEADAGKVFGRIGFQGADVFTKAVSNIEIAHGTITVESNSGFTTGDIIHVGLESMKVTATSSTDTIHVTRGVLGTFPRLHRVDTFNGSYPYVTKPLSNFRGRRVIVYEGYVNDEGGVSDDLSDYVEVFRGFMATEPEIGTSGRSHVVTLEIAPLTAVLDKPLTSVSKSTRLHPVLHAFDGEKCNEVIFASMSTRGSLYSGFALAEMNYSTSAFNHIHDIFSPQILNVSDNTIADFHPRAFSFQIRQILANAAATSAQDSARRRAYIQPSVSFPQGVDTSARHIEDIYPNEMIFRVSSGHSDFNSFNTVHVRSEGRAEARTVKMTTTGTTSSPDVVNWHKTLQTRVAYSMAPGDLSGVDGFLFDVTVEPSAGLTSIKPNFTLSQDAASEPFAFMLLKNHPRYYYETIESSEGIDPAEGLPEITGRVSNGVGYTGYSPVTNEINKYMEKGRLVPREAYNLDDANGGEPIRCQVRTDFAEAGGHIVDTEVATAFFYLGEFPPVADMQYTDCERFVVLEAALGIAASTDQDIGIFSGDGDLLAVVNLQDETSITVDGFSGFRYRVNRVTKYKEVTTVADYAGAERHEFKPAIVPRESSIGSLILKMLCSINGAGTTSSTYDDFIIGAGMSDGTGSHGDDFGADINVDSFLAIQDPQGSEVYAPIYQDGDTLLEAIEGLLAAVGYTVDIRSDAQGRCQLTAVEVTLPNRSVPSASLAESEIADRPTPQSMAEISIKNVFNFSSNYDSDGDAGVELTVKDQVSIDLFNQSEEIDIPLKGISLDVETPGDAVAALRGVFSRLRVENSYPRRVFRFDAPVGVLQKLTLGDTVLLTHELLRASKGLGVTSEPARVRSIEYDGYQPTGTIELVSYGTTGESWSVTAGITSVVDSYNFVVSEETHSPARHPATGDDIEELSGFAVGQAVHVYDVYDMDTPTSATITGINTSTNTITLDTAITLTADSLTLGVRGFITARAKAQADAAHLIYGFINTTVTT